MARPEGFEPPTNGFGSHYSIRLSYERVVVELPRSALGQLRSSHSNCKRAINLPLMHHAGSWLLATREVRNESRAARCSTSHAS